MFFFLLGPNHVNVYLSPLRGVHLVNWSVGEGKIYPTHMPTGAHQPQYFIFYSYGTKPDTTWQFWIDLQVCIMVYKCTKSTQPHIYTHLYIFKIAIHVLITG
jgi:hypothetical protein